MCRLVSLQDTKDHEVDWLNGLGRLRLCGLLVSLLHSCFQGHVIIGPGPPRRGGLDGLDVVLLKNYVIVRPVHGRVEPHQGHPSHFRARGVSRQSDPSCSSTLSVQETQPCGVNHAWYVREDSQAYRSSEVKKTRSYCQTRNLMMLH